MCALKLKVLISGAGIAGPCLAYWLAKSRLDISITIIERSPSPRVTGQAIDIRGSAIDIMKLMKLEKAIRSLHTTEEGTIFVDSSGKSFAEFLAGTTFTAEYEILRADLSQIFLEATEGLSNVQYIYGDFVKSLKPIFGQFKLAGLACGLLDTTIQFKGTIAPCGQTESASQSVECGIP